MQTPPALEPASSAEDLRKAHLNHEASVRSIGTLYYVAAFFAPIAAVAPFFEKTPPSATTWIIAVLLIAMAAVYFQLGRWFRALNSKGKVPATILAIISLLGFPIGTLISIYILYLIHSKKGAVVFSPEYAAVVEATPHIRYKTSIITWIFVGLLVLVLVAMIVAGLSLGR